ncbi:MAG: glycosyltransferase family 39 protein [Anaerolineae bacterium]|nr:glycosyltransferase family 39 protein [Anaerolineae bacterium]
MVSSTVEKRLIALLVAVYVLLGVVYAFKTPLFEAGDELWHYPMVRHLADGNPLPVQVFDPAQAGPWKQQASQPPLYYYLAAGLTFWIDTSDMEEVRWLNPHVDNGIITTDGNINLVVHDPDVSQWRSTALAVRIGRLFSVALGAGTVLLTWGIGRKSVPKRPDIALGAAGMVAFLPMFLFVSGAVNNDNLIMMLAALALFLMVRMVQKTQDIGATVSQVVLLGVVIGAAALSKLSGIGLAALGLGSIFMAQWSVRRRERAVWPAIGRTILDTIWRFLILLIPVALIVGWWYVRNMQLYGDWRGWSAFFAVLGQRAHPATLAQLWDERFGFMMSYWGLFGGVNVPMSGWIYRVLNGLLVVGLLGFAVFVVREMVRFYREWRTDHSGLSIGAVAGGMLDFVERYFGLVACLLWTGAVVYGIIDWATTTWSSQGRLVFSALSAEMILLATGLAGLFSYRSGRWIMGAVVGFLFVVAALAPFVWIAPAYSAENVTQSAEYMPVNYTFGDVMELTGYHVSTMDAQPGDAVDVTLEWQVLQEMDRDWSVFVHFTDPVTETPAAQRDMFPGQGLLATRLLEPGNTLVNRYHVVIPPTATSPATLALSVGLYDYATGERLQTETGADTVVLDAIQLLSRSGEVPNPTNVNLGDELEIVGYEIDERRVAVGGEVVLTVYIRPIDALDRDYTIFAQLIDPGDNTRWAAFDLPQATTQWSSDTVQTVTLPLHVDPAAPAGVFPLIVGAYTSADGIFENLPIVVDKRITNDNFYQLTQVRIDE